MTKKLGWFLASCRCFHPCRLFGIRPAAVAVRPVGPGVGATVGRGGHPAFILLGRYDDSLERDLTDRSRFAVSNPSLLRMQEIGQVTALADGTATVTAAYRGIL